MRLSQRAGWQMDRSFRPPRWLVLTEAVAVALLASAVSVARLPSEIAALSVPFDWIVYGTVALFAAGWLTGTLGAIVWLRRLMPSDDVTSR